MDPELHRDPRSSEYAAAGILRGVGTAAITDCFKSGASIEYVTEFHE